MHDIFISYSSKDREWVVRLAKALETQGYAVWWDPEILPGQHYQDVIQKALHGAKSVVAVWTADSVQSDYVRAECLWAFTKRNLISVLGKDAEIPTPFNAIQAADLRKWKGSADDPEFRRLLRGIRFAQTGEVLQPPKVEQPPPKSRMGVVLAGVTAVAVTSGGIYLQQNGYFTGENVAAIAQPVEPVAEPKVMPAPVATLPVPAPAVVQPATPPKQPEPKTLPFEPEMVDIIPEGSKPVSFTMGCKEGRDDVDGGCFDDEKPAHKVTLTKPYKLAKTEVTVAQFRAFVDATGYKTTAEEKGSCWSWADGWKEVKGNSWRKLGFEQGDDHPVACISWDDAQAYVDWLKKETQNSYRLPTEAEWEYAARGGKEGAYPWEQSIGKNNANCSGDLCGDKFEYTSPVGSFAANPFGLKDMHGNVWEWVSDWKGDYAAEPQQDPKGSSSGTLRVLRGGSWYYKLGYVRSALRDFYTPDYRHYDLGFRPAQGQVGRR